MKPDSLYNIEWTNDDNPYYNNMNEDLEDEVEDDEEFDAETIIDDDSEFANMDTPLSQLTVEEQNETLKSVIDRMVDWLAASYDPETLMDICSNEMGLSEDEILELVHVKQPVEEHATNVTPEERATLQESINKKMAKAKIKETEAKCNQMKITESMDAEARKYGFRNYKEYLNNC